VPAHVGYILDGNRRWARKQGLAVMRGHERGKTVVREIVKSTFQAGVKYVTIYAFSTENWRRDSKEVSFLMSNVVSAFDEYLEDFVRDGIKIMLLGSRAELPADVRDAIENAEQTTSANTKAVLGICLNYGGHEEIMQAVQRIVRIGTKPEDIDESIIEQNLYAPEIPPCDVIVRTSGEQRLSNFMLWRAAYSELIFIDKLWPEMTNADVNDILEEYKRRGRRFGG